jgi:hypothetical protein
VALPDPAEPARPAPGRPSCAPAPTSSSVPSPTGSRHDRPAALGSPKRAMSGRYGLYDNQEES